MAELTELKNEIVALGQDVEALADRFPDVAELQAAVASERQRADAAVASRDQALSDLSTERTADEIEDAGYQSEIAELRANTDGLLSSADESVQDLRAIRERVAALGQSAGEPTPDPEQPGDEDPQPAA